MWTGRVRAYLIKKGIPYQEIRPAEERYRKTIFPRVGYFAIPVTELTDGTLIQDGTDTMEYFEARHGQRPMVPATPLLRAVAWLIELFGCDLFFIPAMHYRWNFPEQEAFIRAEFVRLASAATDTEMQNAHIEPTRRFFKDFPRRMGINEKTIPAIEASHVECLEHLNEHFAHHPYILGGHPSYADFGLVGPLYAHLGRDPVPAKLMKTIAPHVYRWTERMFEANELDFAFTSTPYAFPTDDRVPQTLIPFIEYLFRDCGPQLRGMLDTYNAWATDQASLPSGAPVQADPDAPAGAHPQLGTFEFNLRGTTIHTEAYANVVYHFQRVADILDALDDDGRGRFDALMARTGGGDLMATRLVRRMKFEYYRFLLA